MKNENFSSFSFLLKIEKDFSTWVQALCWVGRILRFNGSYAFILLQFEAKCTCEDKAHNEK